MKYCQVLYQNGFITYMRTENTKYSPVFLNEMKEFISKKWNDAYVGDFENIVNKDNGNPHEAIRVTNLSIYDLTLDLINEITCENNEENIEEDNKDKNDSKTNNKILNSLYKSIWKNTVESCMTNAIYETTKIYIDSPLEHSMYVHTINKPCHLGWKIISNEKEEKENQSSQSALLLFFNSIKKTEPTIICNNINATVSFYNRHSHYTESSLIKKLEELKIGRPSTFSTLVDTIQSRGYVKKLDIEGVNHTCKEFTLVDNKITGKNIEKTIGNEKNKLVIQPLGITTIDFLIQHFESLFSYDYTKKMEEQLDLIACPDINDDKTEWYTICKICSNEIDGCTKPISKQKYIIDDQHILVFEKFGPVIKHRLPSINDPEIVEYKKEEEEEEENPAIIVKKKGKKSAKKTEKSTDKEDKWEYKSIKKDFKIDLEKLIRGEYTLEELTEPNNIYLGLWKGKEVFVKNGQYGNYIEYDEKRQNIKNIEKSIKDITLTDVEIYLKAMTHLEQELNSSSTNDESVVKIYQNVNNKNILRVLNKDFSIRSGKFGPYIYHKKDNMNKPQFYNIRGFKEGFSVCDVNVLLEWIYMTYKIPRY